jgi:hypothetical protein
MKKLLQLIPLLLLVTLAMAQTQHGRITQQSGVGVNTFDGIIVLTTSSLAGEVTFGTGGVAADGDGFKHKRDTEGCATAATAGASCDVTITWATVFVDDSYSVDCGGLGITSGVPVNGGVHTQLAASVQFRTVAVTAAAAEFDKVVCAAAVHD